MRKMVCECGHKAIEHDYNIDSRTRDKCHPRPIHIRGKYFRGVLCDCNEFIKKTSATKIIKGNGK